MSIRRLTRSSQAPTTNGANGTPTAPPRTGSAPGDSNGDAKDSLTGSQLLLSYLGHRDSQSESSLSVFLRPPKSIPDAALRTAKEALDALAPDVADEQALRLRNGASRKSKRQRVGAEGGGDVAGEQPEWPVAPLKIRRMHVDGFETGQAWQQARRMLEGVLAEARAAVAAVEAEGALDGEVEGRKVITEGDDVNGDEMEVTGDEEDEDEGEDEDEEEEEDEEDEEEEDEDELDESMEVDEHNLEGMEADAAEVEGDDADGVSHDDGDDEDDEDDENTSDEDEAGTKEYKADPHGLNDGFFDLDVFNKQTQWLEEQDARGDPNTDLVSDDEGVDWHSDPFAATNKKKTASGRTKKNGRKNSEDPLLSDAEVEDDDSEDAGPTFGDMDLDAPEGDSELESGREDGNDGDSDDLNANDIYYKDFYEPPAKKSSGKGKGKSKKGRHMPTPPPQGDDGDVERAMADVRRDLFEDLSEREDSDDVLSDVSAGDPKSRRSTQERRLAKLAEEIRRLEAESVAKRDWTMIGEASAVDRPTNAALEEDFDFEYAGKPLPVITNEVSEDIEAMIKRRILAREFDEVIRRRPETEVKDDTRRGLVDIDISSKSKQSLAEVYEEEYVKAKNPDTYVSAADEKLRKEEAEVAALWRDVCARLDALASWHYRPRPPEAAVTVVADVPTVAMEDAQPATAAGIVDGARGAAVTSRLAPQETYKPGAKGTTEKGEVVDVRSGLPIARQEMSREEKARRRRRAKERISKAGGLGGGNATKNGAASAGGKKAQMQRETIAELKKGGVKVINRKGEIVDMDGNKAKAARPITSASVKL